MLTLASTQALVTLNGVLDDPVLTFDALKGRVQWMVKQRAGAPAQIRVQIPQLTFANPDAAGAVHAVYKRSTNAGLGALDLSVTFERLLVARIPRYLPSRMNAALRTYLSHALKGGVARQAVLDVRGDLDHFPFQQSRTPGVFRVIAPFENGQFDPSLYAEDGSVERWPALEDIQGVFKMDRHQLSFDINQARYRNIVLTGIRGYIGDLSEETDDLVIDGRARGPLANLLHYANTSPVSGWLDGLTEHLEARGEAKLALQIRVPRVAHEKLRTTGTLTFLDNTLIRNTEPPLTTLNGVLDFTEHGWTLQYANAYFLGGAVTGAGGLKPDGSIHLAFDGAFSAAALRAASSGLLNRLTQRLEGAAPYRITVNALPHAPLHFIITSNLDGLAIDLPAPFGKTAQMSLPVQTVLESVPLTSEQGAASLTYPSATHKVNLRDFRLGSLAAHGSTRGRASEINRGYIQLSADAPTPPSHQTQKESLTAQINLNILDLDAWRAVVEPLFRSAEHAGQFDLLSAYWPSRIRADVDELTLAHRRWRNLKLNAARQEGAWRATLAADEHNLGQLEAAFRETGDRQLSSSMSTRASVWQLDTLHIRNPDAQLEARGRWRRASALPDRRDQSDEAHDMALDFTLKLHNAGALLTRLGLPQTLHGGQGVLTGQLGWRGAAHLSAYSGLNGSLTLDLQRGRILSLDLGLGQLLGILSVQGWARVLSLNTHSAFGPGLGFDRIRAAGIIRHGIMHSQDFEIESQNARIGVQGNVDLADQTQNLQVTFVPIFKADAAALVAAAINPLIGIGGYVMQWALLPSIANGFARQYQVTGTWRQPTIHSIQIAQPSEQKRLNTAQNTSQLIFE